MGFSHASVGFEAEVSLPLVVESTLVDTSRGESCRVVVGFLFARVAHEQPFGVFCPMTIIDCSSVGDEWGIITHHGGCPPKVVNPMARR